MKSKFNAGDLVSTRFDTWTIRLKVIKSKNIKRAKTIMKNGSVVKMYPKSSKKVETHYEFSKAGNYLHRNKPYKVIGFTANGGVLLDGFTLPVSAKHLTLAKPF